MKGKFLRSYRSKAGNIVFVYAVTGSAEQIANYKKIQGENFRESEDKTPLWFTTRFAGNSCDLIATQNGKVVADMSSFDQAASIASQYGGNLGEELARTAAHQLLGGNSTAQAVGAGAPAKIDNL